MHPRTTSWCLVAILVLTGWLIAPADAGAAPVGTSFTYQGILASGTGPANGAFDFRFILYNADAGGSQVGSTVLVDDLMVVEGRVVTTLDFGAVFTGDALWLEVAVREGALTGGYTTLSPRQPLSATPYAQRAASAATAATATTATSAGYATSAGNAAQLNGQSPSYYLAWANLTGVPASLADGDDDTLAGLSCGEGQVVSWSGGAWVCAADAGSLASTYVVGPVGDAAANGTALLAAVAALPAATEAAPLVVKLESGVYDLGVSRLLLPAWVGLEGSGREGTVITSAVCGTTSDATLFVSGTSEVSRVSVENTCAGADFGIGVLQGWGARLTSVAVTSAGNATNSYAIRVFGDSARMNDVDAVILGGSGGGQRVGVSVTQPDLEVHDLRVSVTGGSGTTRGIWSFASGALTLHDTVITVASSTTNAEGLFVENAVSLEIERARVTASSSASSAYGMRLLLEDGFELTMTDAGIRAAGGANTSYGVLLDGGGLAALERVDLEAEGSARALLAQSYSSVNLDLRLAESHLSSDQVGLQVYKAGTGAVTALTSGGTIHGTTSAVSGVAGTEVVRVGGGQLSGGPVGGSVTTCAGVWDENYTFHTSTCP